MALGDEECPEAPSRETQPQSSVLGQFLTSALGSICRTAEVAPSLVGTASDVRELVAYRLALAEGNVIPEPPLLDRGWRAEVVGRVIDDLLDGKLSVRIQDPRSDDPLSFEPAR
jgi:ribonuclease D